MNIQFDEIIFGETVHVQINGWRHPFYMACVLMCVCGAWFEYSFDSPVAAKSMWNDVDDGVFELVLICLFAGAKSKSVVRRTTTPQKVSVRTAKHLINSN